MNPRTYLCVFLLPIACQTKNQENHPQNTEKTPAWEVNSTDEWTAAIAENDGFELKDGRLTPKSDIAQLRSKLQSFDKKQRASSIIIEQSPDWLNWTPVPSVGPSNLADAPVFLARGKQDYWLFGRYGNQNKRENFQPEKTTLDGFDLPLLTTPFPNQFDAPGGTKPSLGGYHAWQSRDMIHWVHHGPITEKFSRWVTTAEMVDGSAYIYYDYPNDQDPHVYVDDDLTDGLPGKNHGMAFQDPTHGSDCAVIRDLEGHFHIIYEDWTPINARKHSWDSPLAGHAVSHDGLSNFKILSPVVDQRTNPTGKIETYLHPHWKNDHPDWDSNVAEYEVHEPTQNAFGDWAAIAIGGRYYLFCDYHPANDSIRTSWFTSPDVNGPFEFCGEIGSGHPDPDIGFANEQFYLITQTNEDYVSPGPWVGDVEVRVGVDTNGNETVDHWSDWQLVREHYKLIEGFSKQIHRSPAAMDVSELPAGHGFTCEIRVRDTTANASKPVLERVTLSFEPAQ